MKIRSPIVLAGVSEAFGIPVEDILGPSREQRLVLARNAAYLIARRMTGMSYPQVGRVFNRDHSTIIAGVAKCCAMMRASPGYRARVVRAAREAMALRNDPFPAPARKTAPRIRTIKLRDPLAGSPEYRQFIARGVLARAAHTGRRRNDFRPDAIEELDEGHIQHAMMIEGCADYLAALLAA